MSANFSLFLNFFFPPPPFGLDCWRENERDLLIKETHKQAAQKKRENRLCLRSRVLRRGVVLLLARTNTRASVVEAQEESQCNERNTLHLRRVKARRR